MNTPFEEIIKDCEKETYPEIKWYNDNPVPLSFVSSALLRCSKCDNQAGVDIDTSKYNWPEQIREAAIKEGWSFKPKWLFIREKMYCPICSSKNGIR
jgi:hypothetical protein